eukprot:5651501-Pleurochrysis_carterae.AAC.1
MTTSPSEKTYFSAAHCRLASTVHPTADAMVARCEVQHMSATTLLQSNTIETGVARGMLI